MILYHNTVCEGASFDDRRRFMIKTLTKVLTIFLTGMIFTFGLTGCIPAESHSQSEVSQSEVSLEISSAAEIFSTEELEIAKNQLPVVIEILINATLSEEPIKDGSRMSMESIWRFIFSLQILNKKEIRILQVYTGKKSIKNMQRKTARNIRSNASIFLWNMFNKLRMNFSA